MNDPITPQLLDNFCGSRNFTTPPKLIQKFQDKNGNELKGKLKEFLSNTQHTMHTNNINICMERANVICGPLGSSTSQNPCTTVLIWDNVTSFGLTQFKSDLIGFANFIITDIVIGTTLHKFVETNDAQFYKVDLVPDILLRHECFFLNKKRSIGCAQD